MLFLSERSAEDADMVLRLLLDRIERSECEGAGYRTLPFRWHEPLQFRSAPSFGTVLCTIRDWVAASPDVWQRAQYGADLFRGVAGDFDDQVLRVLEDGVATGDPNQVRAVGALLGKAPGRSCGTARTRWSDFCDRPAPLAPTSRNTSWVACTPR